MYPILSALPRHPDNTSIPLSLLKRPRAPAFLSPLTPSLTTPRRTNPVTALSLLPCRPFPTLKLQPHALRMSANDNGEKLPSDEDAPEDGGDMYVYRKGTHRLYTGDLLPFDVEVTSPPPAYLGRFRLDSRTHCGDVVEHDGKQFVVKRVRMQYKYTAGSYRVVRKSIEVKSLARKTLETYLERVLNES